MNELRTLRPILAQIDKIKDFGIATDGTVITSRDGKPFPDCVVPDGIICASPELTKQWKVGGHDSVAAMVAADLNKLKIKHHDFIAISKDQPVNEVSHCFVIIETKRGFSRGDCSINYAQLNGGYHFYSSLKVMLKQMADRIRKVFPGKYRFYRYKASDPANYELAFNDFMNKNIKTNNIEYREY